MKKTLFATAFAVAAVVSAPAFAEVSGYAGVSYNRAEVQISGIEADGDAFAVAGALSAPISDALSIQADASYTDSDDADGVLMGQVHLVGDIGEDMRIGAFVGAADVMDETAIGGGVEGQANFSKATLVGTAAYGTVDELDVNAWGLSGEARFFPMDNLRIDTGLSWASIDTPLGDGEGWNAGVGAEYQFSGPVSVFAGYSYTESDDVDLAINAISVGVRVNFGGTLRDRDRNGASFGGIGNLLSLVNF